MHPLLLKIGPIPIYSYGFLIAIGFLAAVWVSQRLATREGVDIDRVIDLCFWCLVTGFLGARILFVITMWRSFAADPLAIFRVWEGGLVFYGGPLAAVPAGLWYIRKHRMNPWRTIDVLVPGLTIAHMFGRFGCLAAGCCYGRPTGSGFGVRLTSELVDPEFRGIPLHPTQLYEAGSLFCLFIGLLWLSRRKSFDGQVALTYFMAYAVIRSVIEIFRGDQIRGFLIQDILSTSQFISLLVFSAALAFLVYRLRQVRQVHAE